MNRKAKNIILGIIILIFTIIICTGVYFIGIKFNKNNNSYSNVISLSVNELQEKINNKDSFILVFTRTGCTHCESFIPMANKVGQQYNITFYEINLANVKTSEEKTQLRNIANVEGTPTSIFIVNGIEKSITSRLVGEVKEYKLIEKLKNEGYINE